MSDQKVSSLAPLDRVERSDRFYIARPGSPGTSWSANLAIITESIYINQATPDAMNPSGYTPGTLLYDQNNLFVVVSNTEIKRVPLLTIE